LNARALSVSTTAADLLSLTKPRLSSLILVTTAGGMRLANGHMSIRALAVLLAVAGIVGAANALNCYIERDVDRLMVRTRSRPLPSGRMDPQLALWFGISLATISFPALVLTANLLTAILGLIAFLCYVFVYTPLKARSYTAMLVGAIPGALPTLMGWTAATGNLGRPGLALFAILFFWQLPHFIAIALNRKEEYAAAGLKSLPLVRGDQAARVQLVIYVALLVGVTMLPYVLGSVGRLYLLVALGFGAGFLGLGIDGLVRRLGRAWARTVFRFSLVYLVALFSALWVNGVARL
jgi:protoheme IX farnesyltransferase